MGDHYFSNRPTTEHDIQEFTFELRGKPFKFKTDAGVFSRDRIDYGSVLLIEEMLIEKNDNVLDVGCGYGPVGIVAAYLAENGQALMVDVNERAVGLAKQNIALNGINNAKVLVSNLFENIDASRRFDVILTNPPIRAGKQTVHEILVKSWSYLNEGGSLWVVMQKKQGAPSAMKKLEETFNTVERVTQDKGYWIIRAKK